MRMQAKFGGTCRKCQGAISVGDNIEWSRGSGAEHVDCPMRFAPSVQIMAPPWKFEAIRAVDFGAEAAKEVLSRFPETARGSLRSASDVEKVALAARNYVSSLPENEERWFRDNAHDFLNAVSANFLFPDVRARFGATQGEIAALADLAREARRRLGEDFSKAVEARYEAKVASRKSIEFAGQTFSVGEIYRRGDELKIVVRIEADYPVFAMLKDFDWEHAAGFNRLWLRDSQYWDVFDKDAAERMERVLSAAESRQRLSQTLGDIELDPSIGSDMDSEWWINAIKKAH